MFCFVIELILHSTQSQAEKRPGKGQRRAVACAFPRHGKCKAINKNTGEYVTSLPPLSKNMCFSVQGEEPLRLHAPRARGSSAHTTPHVHETRAHSSNSPCQALSLTISLLRAAPQSPPRFSSRSASPRGSLGQLGGREQGGEEGGRRVGEREGRRTQERAKERASG